jgi:bifunctional oligoribonuclease and PAP phosphatase NrnA
MNIIENFLKLTKKAKNIVITTHIHPDADGIGSEIALCLALRELGKNVICVNEEPLLERYKYLDSDNVVISYSTYRKKYKECEIDLFIVTDTNSLQRIGPRVQGLVSHAKDLLFIDHHPCPKQLMALHCIDTSMAATGELVGRLIQALKIPFNQKLALPLYTSILIDTSSFRYPTVTGNTHRVIADLLDTGVQPPQAYNNIYGAKEISYMQLLGIVLSSANSTKDGQVAWLKLTKKDMERFNVDTEDTHGFVNHLLILNNIKVACMFREDDPLVKISFRSAGDIDVGIMAQALGGGGHDHSAATMIEGNIDEIIKQTIPKIKLMLEDL